MSANSTVANAKILADRSLETQKEESVNLLHRIEALLREIFEGHEEFLGVTPD